MADEPSRIRTGDGGFGASKAQQPALFSVGKLGGSDSLLIRPRSVPKLGRARSEKKSATCPAAGTSQIGRTLTLRPRSGTDGLAPSPQLGSRCRPPGFPSRRNEFPAPDHRESVAEPAESLANFGSGSSRRVRYRRSSLYFPCRSGIWPQRRVRPRLHPPPSSLPTQRLFGKSARRPGKIPRFRAVLGEGLRASEPRREVDGNDQITRLKSLGRVLAHAPFPYSRLRAEGSA